MTELLLQAPAKYVPPVAIAIATQSGGGAVVSSANPVPIQTRTMPTTSAALVGAVDASAVAGPFVPELGRSIWITLAGDWAGTVTVLRSIDGGVRKLPLTIAGEQWAQFTANAQEAVSEEQIASASYYLDIVLTAGSLDYRLEQ